MKNVLLLKGLLCSNAYLVVFFPMLIARGLSSEDVLQAIALGTITMVVGDLLSSLVVDRFGPRRPVIVAAVFQAMSMLMLAVCDTKFELFVFELLMGLSFPVIYGADSKWLKHLSVDECHESANQKVFWLSQALSALLGCIFFRYSTFLCVLNAGLYLYAAYFATKLPDVPQTRQNFASAGSLLRQRSLVLLGFGIFVGLLNSASWLLQMHSTKTFQNIPLFFGLLQLVGASLSYGGSFINIRRTHALCFSALGIVLLYIFTACSPGESASNWIIFPVLFGGLILRGTMNVKARKELLQGVPSSGPVSTLNFCLGGLAKITQSAALMALSAVFK